MITEKMKALIEEHGEVMSEVFEDIIVPLLLEQQKISFINDDANPDQLRGFTIAYRLLEKTALEGKKKIEQRNTSTNE